ncbi:MAG: Flp pilus assembly complex ATPase component TadA [Clostridia bacterium]|nr:Flp pilus assembly complex ATPase component TadA [Clostridia bacterium]
MMKLNFLPENYVQALSFLDINKIFQIRVRENYPVLIYYLNEILYLTNEGASKKETNSIIATKKDISFILDVLTEKSIYAFNEQIKNGYISYKNGIRVGLCGECVIDNGQVVTIKNVSSLNIRIPHNVNNCSFNIFNKLLKEEVQNVLIVSPVFCGKTTILKDVALKLNENYNESILIIDERQEFSTITGKNIDKIVNCTKEYAFNYALRSLSPEIIITDELTSYNDFSFVKSAIECGIKVIASCHADDMKSLFNKEFFIKNLFNKYVLLDSYKKFGIIKAVYNKDGKEI